jgi:hypothetical protein
MTKQNQGHSVNSSNIMGFWMRKKRRTYRLADMAAIVFAFLFLALDLMVRDPQPVMTPMAPQGDPALIITLILMGLGLCVIFYGLYLERHKLHTHVRRRLEIRRRFVRREVAYKPGLRRLVRLQLNLSHVTR